MNVVTCDDGPKHSFSVFMSEIKLCNYELNGYY